ncbi:hypothetical protein ASPZODRAFT_142201 [Penicilliopsis zonata CBS 506.65]|uniref:AN1-type domain-containing protein n=1 Tax=Penicilliopsis zonata CBS 506.65 TaxID=1073090 RepID=A0A1L9SGS3_9EURO|nr:hypothetical protein ASPZODRAFT_142201 [Penicilliopsis zonata CBS 506.65]OJJ46381.1 hypothetical protein ASPZODRAFT_142201 [Penicilliopsis zonata CBS 506.65]
MADTQQSFTQMADTDLESIGRHCQLEYCGQLDFLPFRCESCHGTFCLDHRTETAHKCAHAGDWARRRNNNSNNKENSKTGVSASAPQKPTIYNTAQCSHLSCKTLINTLKDPGVRCPNCNREYCLKHRLREEHDCAKIAPLGARAGQARPSPNETIRSMFSKVRSSFKQGGAVPSMPTLLKKPGSGGGGVGGSPVARLNALKRSAKGDAAVPVDKRVYMHVVGTSEDETKPEPPRGDFFYDSRWKVGRVLDDAAKRLRVENRNNSADGEEARLRVFHVESGEFLEFSQSIGEGRVKQGDTIVLLRGAGPLLGK